MFTAHILWTSLFPKILQIHCSMQLICKWSVRPTVSIGPDQLAPYLPTVTVMWQLYCFYSPASRNIAFDFRMKTVLEQWHDVETLRRSLAYCRLAIRTEVDRRWVSLLRILHNTLDLECLPRPDLEHLSNFGLECLFSPDLEGSTKFRKVI